MATPSPNPTPVSNLAKVTPGQKSALAGGGVGQSNLVSGVTKKTPKKAGSTPKKKPQNPLDAVMGFGQGVINFVSTPLYAIEGALNESVRQVKAGETSVANPNFKNPTDLFFKQLGAAGENAVSWTQGKKTITGTDILKTGGAVGPKGSGAAIEEGSPLAFIAGLGLDIALDPLNLVSGKAVVTAAKVVNDVAKQAVRVGADALVKAELPVNVAAKALKVEGEAAKALAESATVKNSLLPKTDKLYKAGRKVAMDATPAGERFRTAQKTIGENLPKFVKYEPSRSALDVVNQTLASAIEGGRAAFVRSVVSERAINFIDKYARQEAKVVRRAAANGVVQEAPASAETKLVDGTKIKLPKNTPYKADNGKFYVTDGKGLYSADSLDKINAFIAENGYKAAKAISGASPVIDAVPADKLPLDLITTLPTTTAEAKVAQHNLDLIQKLARSAVATAGTGKLKQQVSYTGFDDLVNGLKAGHSVDFSSLEKIVDALDPEKRWNRNISNLGKKKAFEFYSNLLTTTGVQTAVKIQQRLDYMTAQNLLKSSGVGNSDTAASLIDGRLKLDPNNPDEVIDGIAVSSILQQSRDAAASRVNEATINPADSFGVGNQLDRVTLAINGGFEGRFNIEKSISSQEGFWSGISTLGDLAIRTSDVAYDANSRAMRKLELNQFMQSGIVSSLLGIASYRAGKKLAANANAIVETPALRMARFVSDIKLSQDVISSTLSSRFVISKWGRKGEVIDPHFVFLHLGDIIEAFASTTRGKNIMLNSFFPEGAAINRQADGMSWIGVQDAVRHIIEMREKNMPISVDELVAKIKTWGSVGTPKGQSATFKATIDKNARDIAGFLLNDKNAIPLLENTHKARLLSATDEALTSAETITEDVYNNFLNAMEINLGKGVVNDEKRIQMLRKLFNDFIYMSGAFKQQSTEVAESVVRAASMIYLNDGKLANLLGARNYTGAKLIETEIELKKILEVANNMFKTEGPASLTGSLGREFAKKATPAQMDNAISKLSEAEAAYAQLRADLAKATTTAEVTAWKVSMRKAQAKLDTARARAEKISIPTRYWTDAGWVPANQFARDLEAQAAIEAGANIKSVSDGVVNIADVALDSPKLQLAVEKVSPYEKKRIMAEYVQKNIDMQMAMRKTDAEESAAKVLNEVGQIESKFENPSDQAQVMYQRYNNENLLKGQTKITRKQEEQIANTKYNAAGDKPQGIRKVLSAINARSGRETLYPFMVKAQAELANAVQSAAHYVERLLNDYIDVIQDTDFDKAYKYALAGKNPPKSAGDVVANLSKDLRAMFDAFFADEGAIIGAGLDGKSIQAAFVRFGLDGLGIPNVSKWGPKRLANLLNELPFGARPTSGDNLTLRQEAWDLANQAMKKNSANQFLTLSKMIQAIEFAKMEKNLVQTFANEFSYLSEGLTLQQALDRGYVAIADFGSVTDLASHLPKPQNGGLFHPDIARQFASVNGEINKLYNSKRMPEYVNTVMELMSAIKATQTIFAPRHHVTNFVGDTSTAIIGGARDVRQWAKAYDMSLRWALDRARVDYDQFAKATGESRTSLSLARAVRHMQGKPNKLMLQEGDSLTASATINGKQFKFDDAELMQELERWGIIVGNQIISDQRSLYESVAAMAGSETRGEMLRAITAKFRKGADTIERPFADLAAAYGNGPRIASALHIMQSRSWKNKEEMFAAMTDHVMRYHPTIYSLAATERRYARLIFSYYTWIRGAHNALLDMALNHTAAMTVYSKAQYQAGVQSGNEPMSIGAPWQNKTSTPGYLNYSTYGPTSMGPNGPMLFKPAILPLDVLDTWMVQFDPALPFDANVANAIKGIGQGVIGKNINFLAQPGLELLTKTDPATGKPSQIKDLASLGDKAISLTGFASPLKGLGLYTPSNKGPEAANPTTQRQRDLTLSNWLGLTMKAQDVNSGANPKNAAAETTSRTNTLLESMAEKRKQDKENK